MTPEAKIRRVRTVGLWRTLHEPIVRRIQSILQFEHGGIWFHPGIESTGSFHPSSRNVDLKFRSVTFDEVVNASADPLMDYSPGFIKSLRKETVRIFGAFDGDLLVGYVFFAKLPRLIAMNLWVEFTADLRYVFKAYTRPEYRGRNLVSEVILYGMDVLQKEHPEIHLRYFASIVIHNYASIQSFERIGFQKIRTFFRFMDRNGGWKNRAGFGLESLGIKVKFNDNN